MTVRVVAIEPTGPGLRARRILLEDFSELTTSDSVVKALRLEVGDRVMPDEFAGSIAALEPEQARERAIRLLAHRERSVSELTRRLAQGGYPEATAASVVAALERIGLVDDARFAEIWTRSRVASGYGARRIRRELADRGVDVEIAEEALAAAVDGASELERARAVVGAHPPRNPRERERLLRRLVNRGFDLTVAARAVDALEALNSDDASSSED